MELQTVLSPRDVEAVMMSWHNAVRVCGDDDADEPLHCHLHECTAYTVAYSTYYMTMTTHDYVASLCIYYSTLFSTILECTHSTY